MENVFRYYGFSDFFTDKSGTFLGNEINFSELNTTHFLVFEKNKETYNLYISQYKSKKEVGFAPPEIVELIIANYDKSLPEHRIAIRKYFE